MSARLHHFWALLLGFALGILAAFSYLPFWSDSGGVGATHPARGSSSSAAPRGDVRPLQAGNRRSPETPAPSLVGQVTSPDALQHASEIWMPLQVAQRLSYSIGSISTTYKMDAETRAALGLDDFTSRKIEADINQLLEALRRLESLSLKYVEQSSDSVLVQIPAGFAPPALLDECRAKTEATMGRVRAELFWGPFLRDLPDVSTAFTPHDRLLRISLQGEDGILIQIDQGNRRTEMNMLPEYLRHIVQVVSLKPANP